MRDGLTGLWSDEALAASHFRQSDDPDPIKGLTAREWRALFLFRRGW